LQSISNVRIEDGWMSSVSTRLREHRQTGAINMDKDRIAGAAKQAKGAIKEATGKAVGDAKLVAEGKNDKVAGKIQNAIGGVNDTVRDAAKK
jgi:uncharacterized protein YjbJ (UPF0337 family)